MSNTHRFAVAAGIDASTCRAISPTSGFLRQPQVLLLVPISKSTLWRRVRDKTFPVPVKLSERITVWRAEDVWAWIDRQQTSNCK